MPGISNSENPEYKGPSKDYAPDLGEVKAGQFELPAINEGYHDRNLLVDNLKVIISRANALIDVSEKKLRSNYTLVINENTKAHEAQQVEWPDSLTGVGMYLSYDQYRILRIKPTRSADYLVKMYEENVRGPAGTNALDVILGVEPLKTESETILNFLDKYMGEVNDSSEYRTLELLQDWSYSALEITGRFRDLYQSEATYTSKIPSSEMARITSESAREFQTLFKVKLNVANNEIGQILKDFQKDYIMMSSTYFDRFLGPALDFRLKTGKGLEYKQGTDSFLAQQAFSAVKALDMSFEGALADQLRRNNVFTQKMDALFERFIARDNYAGMIKDLSIKGGSLKESFKPITISAAEKDAFGKEYDKVIANSSSSNTFKSSHFSLDDNDNPNTHPWALSRWGDVIQGDFTFDVAPESSAKHGPDGEALPFDGMRPGGEHGHKHRGLEVDGTRQIDGAESIEFGTLITPTINDDEEVVKPQNLRLIDESIIIDNKLPVVSSRIAWDCTPDEAYELQVVPYSSFIADKNCVRGHELTYPPVPCEPWKTDRVFLNTGNDTGGTNGNEILTEEGLGDYVVTSAFTVSINDDYFIAGYNGANGKDFYVALCYRNAQSLEWIKLDEIKLTSGTALYDQKFVSATQLTDTDILVGYTSSHNNRPTVSLVRIGSTLQTLDKISSIELMDDSFDMAENWGVNSIKSYNNGSNFVVGYSYTSTSGDETFKLHLNVGSMVYGGASQRNSFLYARDEAIAITSSATRLDSISISLLDIDAGLISWRNTTDAPIHYAKAFGMLEQQIVGVSESAHDITSLLNGKASVSPLNANTFVSIYSQQEDFWSNPNFSDVDETHVMYDDIAWAVHREITTGYTDGTFRPGNPTTRLAVASVMYLLWQSFGNVPETYPNPGFSDIGSLDAKYYEAISWMKHVGITTGYDDGTFRPSVNVNRETIAIFLYRLWEVIGGDMDDYPDPGFTDVPSSHPSYEEISWMAAIGVTIGYSNGTYKPADVLLRQTFVLFLHRFAKASGFEPTLSQCSGITNPKALVVDTYAVDLNDYSITNSDNTSYVIDSALHTNSPPISTFQWSQNKVAAIWGSSFDAPNADVELRTKLAILDYDRPGTRGSYVQQTWDLPINTPAPTEYCELKSSRMGNSDYILLSAAGGPLHSPVKYDKETDEFIDNSTESINYVDWTKEVSAYNPTGATGTRSGSAVVTSDGRVMYVWSEGDKIKRGYATDVETFSSDDETIEDIEDIFTGLTSPTCSTFKDSYGDLYVAMICAAQSVDGEKYGHGGSIVVDASTAPYPWHLIYKSEDDGLNWSLHSVIEWPGGDTHLTRTWNVASATASASGIEAANRIPGQPYIDGDTWLYPSYFHEHYLKPPGTWFKAAFPAIWMSTDNGTTWSIKLFPTELRTDAPHNTGPGSRNITKHGSYLWYTLSEREIVNQHTYFYVSEDHGLTWRVSAEATYTPSYAPRAGSLISITTSLGNILHIVREDGIIGRYSKSEPLPINFTSPADPFNSITSSYEEIVDHNFGTKSPDLIVQSLDDYYVIIQSGNVVGFKSNTRNIHSGVSALIIDTCSSESQ